MPVDQKVACMTHLVHRATAPAPDEPHLCQILHEALGLRTLGQGSA